MPITSATANKRLQSVLGRMTDMDHQTVRKTLVAQLYGPFGSGKTVLSAALAQELKGDGNILWIDSSDGWVTLEDFPELQENVTHFRYSEPLDVSILANAIQTKAKAKLNGETVDFSKFTVVVVDEMTSIHNETLARAQRERMGLEPDEVVEEVPDRKDYNLAANITKRNFSALHRIDNLHIILTGHERTQKVGTREDDPYRYFLDYNPAAATALARDMHVIGYVTASDKRNPKTKLVEYSRTVQCAPTTYVQAKSRIGSLGLTETFDSFIDKVVTWTGSSEQAHALTTSEADSETDVAPEEDDDSPVYAGE